MKAIIYPNELGGICLLYPAGALPVEEVARKDVPTGAPYIIIDAADIPTDRTFRDAWEADFAQPHGHGMGSEAWFAEQATKTQEASDD